MSLSNEIENITEYKMDVQINKQLFAELDPVRLSIERLKAFEPSDGYYLAFSGGKDSQCVYHLAKMAGVKFDAHYHLTTVDPPELVNFIRSDYPDVVWDKPRYSMWQLIEENGFPPMRMLRYCCKELKERFGKGRVVLTGIRWQESARRGERNMFEKCNTSRGKRFLHPIIDWSDDNVWGFLKQNNIKHCSLYDEGRTRLGCIMCPMSGTHGMLRDAKRWPKYFELYRRAIKRGFERFPDRKNRYSKSPDEMMAIWIYGHGDVVDIEQSPLFCKDNDSLKGPKEEGDGNNNA